MLVVHHLGLSQSERIVWLCEELAIPYVCRRYDRRADNGAAPEDYKALHPMGTAPAITDGAVVLAESGAIVAYICARYGAGLLVPDAHDPDFPDHLFWLHWSNATFMTSLMMEIALRYSDVDPATSFAGDRARRCWEMCEERLGAAPYFGGRNLTTADIMMVYILTTFRLAFGISIERFPNIRDYLHRIGERTAYRSAMAMAEPGLTPHLA